MFDRYTEDARQVIFLARYEASRLGSPVLETEHLWLGLLRHNKKLVKRLAPHVSLEAVAGRLKHHGTGLQRISMTVEMPLSDEARRALAGAATEADQRGQKHITADYLVLALLREESPTSPTS